MPDLHTNFAVSLVATAPSPATTGTSLVVTAGQGTRFPDPGAGAYNAIIWPAGELPTPANAEIVRITDVATDTLTITREQEGSSARTVVVGDQIAVSITKKSFTDIENAIAARVFNSAVIGVANTTVVALTFDSERYDSDALHSTSSNTGRLTAPIAGKYHIGTSVAWSSAAGGMRLVSIRINGTTEIATQFSLAGLQSVSADYELAAGDYAEVIVYQDAGGPIDIDVQANRSPEFWMHRIGN